MIDETEDAPIYSANQSRSYNNSLSKKPPFSKKIEKKEYKVEERVNKSFNLGPSSNFYLSSDIQPKRDQSFDNGQ